MSLLMLLTLLVPVDPPRYRLEPGLELHYTIVYPSSGDAAKKQPATKSTALWQILVLNQNADGSYRVVVFNQYGSENKNARWDARRLDLFPDGKAVNESEPDNSFGAMLLPPLPQGNDKEWSKTIEREQARCQFSLISNENGVVKFKEVRTSPVLAIYDVEGNYEYTFDPAQGFITGGTGARKKYDDPEHLPYKHSGSSDGTQLIELVSKKTHPAEWVAARMKETDTYFALKENLLHSYVEGRKQSPTEATKLITACANKWKEAQPLIQHPALASLVAMNVKDFDRYTIRGVSEDAKRRAEIIGKPVPTWEAKDFNGKAYSSESLRGKVVILDFWYRGCLWCVRAMPQVNQLAADFKNNDNVVILGVNIDEDPADARFVIRQAKLTYPNLEFKQKLEGDSKIHPLLHCNFGYPTLLVIDQQGKVIDIHAGYSPTLRKDVAESVRKVLGK